ncbi:hypothetical protein HMI55_003852, partial [Coelomomyces lativittatus]
MDDNDIFDVETPIEEDQLKMFGIQDWNPETDGIEYCIGQLPLRQMILDYEICTQSIPTGEFSNKEPEIRYFLPGMTLEGKLPLYIPKRYFPVVSVPYLNNETQSIYVLDRLHEDPMKEADRIMRAFSVSNSKWCYQLPTLEVSVRDPSYERLLCQSRMCSLHFFHVKAIVEAFSMGSQYSIWKEIYKNLIDYTRHPGLYRTIHDNSLVDMFHYESSDETVKYNHELRKTESSWMGFKDCSYTPASLEAGRIRSLMKG